MIRAGGRRKDTRSRSARIGHSFQSEDSRQHLCLRIHPGVDADGSGMIDYTEFLAATLDRCVLARLICCNFVRPVLCPMPGSVTCRRMFATTPSALTLRESQQLLGAALRMPCERTPEVSSTRTEMVRSRWRCLASCVMLPYSSVRVRNRKPNVGILKPSNEVSRSSRPSWTTAPSMRLLPHWVLYFVASCAGSVLHCMRIGSSAVILRCTYSRSSVSRCQVISGSSAFLQQWPGLGKQNFRGHSQGGPQHVVSRPLRDSFGVGRVFGGEQDVRLPAAFDVCPPF